MKKRRRLKKKIRNRLILAFGLLIALFILITLIKGIVGVVLRAKCKNVANKMQKIGFKKRHFKRLLNAK